MHNVSLSRTRSILINYKSRLETSSRHYRARSMLALRASLSLFCLSFVSRCEGGKLIYRSGASTYFTLLSQASLIVVLSDSLFSREQDYREERPDFNSTSPKERREGRIKKEKKKKKKVSSRSRVNARPVSHPHRSDISAEDKPHAVPSRNTFALHFLDSFPENDFHSFVAATSLG